VTRRYEIVYIFDSTAEEAQVDQTLERFHALLKSKENSEPIRNVNHWGKRTLAYSIGGNEIGYYVVAQFATDPTLLPEFERLLKLEESVIRYQIVLNEGEVPVPAPLPDIGNGAKPSDGLSKPDVDSSNGSGKKDKEGTDEEN
jgi:small subunit ribosomal protein S6